MRAKPSQAARSNLVIHRSHVLLIGTSVLGHPLEIVRAVEGRVRFMRDASHSGLGEVDDHRLNGL